MGKKGKARHKQYSNERGYLRIFCKKGCWPSLEYCAPYMWPTDTLSWPKLARVYPFFGHTPDIFQIIATVRIDSYFKSGHTSS